MTLKPDPKTDGAKLLHTTFVTVMHRLLQAGMLCSMPRYTVVMFSFVSAGHDCLALHTLYICMICPCMAMACVRVHVQLPGVLSGTRRSKQASC